MTLGDRLRRVLRQQARKAGEQYAESKRAYTEGRKEGVPESDWPDGDWSESDGPETDGSSRPDDSTERLRVDPTVFGLPATDDGDTRIVCRRYVERRTVAVDTEGRPACFEPGNDDCEGCAVDVREGRVQTW
jgi:hypothetical protein